MFEDIPNVPFSHHLKNVETLSILYIPIKQDVQQKCVVPYSRSGTLEVTNPEHHFLCKKECSEWLNLISLETLAMQGGKGPLIVAMI